MNEILTLADMRAKFNIKSQAKLIAWLNKKGIKWDTDPNDQPFTTLVQVDRQLEGKADSEEAEF